MTTDILPQKFEYPLPRLTVSGGRIINDKLIIEATREGISGELVLKNSGGQLLEGALISANPMLTLSAESFSANLYRLAYSVPKNSCDIGEIIHTSLIISSSGGEKVLSVIIKIVPRTLELGGTSIRSLKDFATYARKQPQAAAIAFIGDSFGQWLGEMDTEHTEIYAELRKAPNPRLSLEAFLVLHKLKNPVTLSIIGSPATQEHEIVENVTAPVHGTITLGRSQWGHFEQEVYVKYSSAWLRLAKPIITEDDFAGSNTATVAYSIDPSKIQSGRVSDKITVGNLEIGVKVKASPLFVCHLPNAYFKNGNRGKLAIRNLSGGEALLELSASDSFIRLDTKEATLPPGDSTFGFTVKLSPIQSAQMLIKKQPTASGEIHARLTQGNRVFTKKMNITIGEIDQ